LCFKTPTPVRFTGGGDNFLWVGGGGGGGVAAAAAVNLYLA
jgi:hypothetical protein